jgi:hypothetical protein
VGKGGGDVSVGVTLTGVPVCVGVAVASVRTMRGKLQFANDKKTKNMNPINEGFLRFTSGLLRL